MKYFYFAQAYGEGTYGECTYNELTSSTQSSCPGSESGSGGGGLADTGIWVVAVITLACLITFAALLVRFWKRKPHQPQEPEQVSPSQPESDEQKSSDQ